MGKLPLPGYYNRTLQGAAKPAWKFSTWVPDVVRICARREPFNSTSMGVNSISFAPP